MVICEIKKRLRDFELDISFTLGKETLVIVGHSGCGKSTTLRVLAGLLKPDEGEIVINDQLFFSRAEKVNLAPEERGIGFLFQNYALFPHMTVYENVAYGLESKKLPKPEVNKRVLEQLEALQILQYKNNMPNELSGGQQQRVALARAVVVQPKILLLDEPLSALDVTTRAKVRRELKKTLSSLKIPAIIVTHDYEDAISLGDRILVMDKGKVLQQGTAAELIAKPKSSFVADFSGTNYFKAKLIGEKQGLMQFLVDGAELPLLSKYSGDGELSIMIHPWDIQLSKQPVHVQDMNVIQGTIINILSYGNRTRIDIEGTIPLTIEQLGLTTEELELIEGDTVYALVDPKLVHVL